MGIVIELEHCESYNDTLGITCMEKTEAVAAQRSTTVFIEYKYKQIDMKNQSQPIQSLSKILPIPFSVGYFNQNIIKLGYDEFYDKTDPIGIVDSDVEPFEFLSMKSESNSFTKLPDERAHQAEL